jgi:glycosyltransferase involved in cell wall biosynthesis
MKKIFIVHPGKAHYPELEAYKSYFAGRFDVFEGTSKEFEKIDKKNMAIVWCIMGFFPVKPDVDFVIHDYRSLSVGRLSRLKDLVKRYLNAKPNLRIFQNEFMQREMGFKDDIDSLLLPMGVPECIANLSKEPIENKIAKYCYIGEMSYERGFNEILDAFLKLKTKDEFLLIGKAEKQIIEKYSQFECLKFIGRKSQIETFKLVRLCEYAVCYCPYHYPYNIQTPTKFLEYAALGAKIICNDAPSNIRSAKELDYPCVITDRNIFDSEIDSKLESISFVDRTDISLSELSWARVIYNSRIDEIINNHEKHCSSR